MIITQEQLEEFMNDFKTLLWSDEGEVARQFLLDRGIKDLSILSSVEIGYCPPTFDYPSRNSLYVDKHMWQMRGRLVVPIRDQYGRILSFAGRIIEHNRDILLNDFMSKANGPLFQYYKGDTDKIHKLMNDWSGSKWINEIYRKNDYLFNLNQAKYHIFQREYAIVVEGYMDAIILAAFGFPNTVALCGVKMSDMHIALLRRYTKHLVYCLDDDASGQRATETATRAISMPDIDMSHYKVLLPKKGEKSLDPDEVILDPGFRTMFTNALEEAGKRRDDKTYIDLSDPMTQMIFS